MEVQIILAATSEKTCPVQAFHKFFIQDSYSPNAPFFQFFFSAFSCQNIVVILKKRIVQVGLFEVAYLGYSFRKNAVQHTTDYKMLNKSIQRLGRWTSNVFKLYFTTLLEAFFNLNFSFQKNMLLAVLRVTTTSTKPNQLPKAQDKNTKTS